MNNTLHTELFSISQKAMKKLLLLALLSILFFYGNVSHAQVTIISDNFETGFGNWNDGGGDCERNNNTLLGGNWNIRLRDNSGVASSMTSDPLNFSPYNQVDITFNFYFNGFENGESFFIQYFSGGPTYTLATFTVGSGFNNNTVYTTTLTISASAFVMGSNSLIRIRSDASVNNDQVFIDDINIVGTGFNGPTNDECSNAISLTPNSSCTPTTGTTLNATQSLSGCSGTADDDVWYSFVATNTQHEITVEASTINDIVFQVFDSCGGSSLVCRDSTFGFSDESATLTGLTVGNTYFVRVYSWSSASSSQGEFSICVVTPPPPPANDECANAIAITPGIVCTPTTGTTLNATQSLSGCSGVADDDVWYSFVATNTEQTITVETTATNSIGDLVFQVFDNCGGSSLVCEDSTAGFSDETATLTGLTVGATYYVRVYSWSSASTRQGEFTICVTEPCTPSTANGTSALACPSVGVGGIDVTGGTAIISCSAQNTVLEASYLELGDTSSYDVEAITYSPPFQFTCLANPVSVNLDDVFSPVVNLPFDFCFYGNTYNSCVVGSNGVISFDTSLANSNSGWRILQNIPSTINATDFDGPPSSPRRDYFFGPSIYGVHHDVDPSVGGEIGWQLVTLDTGCQALVAAWSDVPMFSNNSILYSGMMVFYEDTNVIEIYIEEKNIDGTWNSGNATVGLQADATEATVAPLRNSLQPDWTAIQEAWRFTPSGPSITDLKWYANSISAANEIIDPNDDGAITVAPTTTTDYIAEVTYTLCTGATITETDLVTVSFTGGKVWNGSQSTAWEDPDNWTPVGVPVSTDCIEIPVTVNQPIMAATTDGNGLNMTVYNGATLTQEPNSSLTIVEEVTINTGGTYSLEDSASLIQVDDVTNIVDGLFEMDRSTNIRINDYVYWSSPVTAFNIEDVSPGTPNGLKYQWLPFLNRTPSFPNPLDFGEWENYNTGTMEVGRGYIVRGPSGHTSTPSAYTATFNGTPNNGDILKSIQRSNYTGANYTYQPYAGGDILLITSDDDNWNLIGNPYPSAINAIDFLTHPSNTNIQGNVYIWTHGTEIGTGNSDPFYEDYTYNYNIADYIAYNASGTSTPSGFSGNIGAGQGFFVLMNDSGSTSETITFSNTMRSSAYNNNQFYRNSGTSDGNSRIWLDFISSNGNTNTTLVAYVDGATNGQDRMFDAINAKGNGLNLYSMIEETSYIIQGRQWPFVNTDQVPLGINITETGIQTIAINLIEGEILESNQDIYLEDTELNIIHDLKASPYTFTANPGILNERFILRYNNSTLGIDDEIISNLSITSIHNRVNVTSSLSSIKTFKLFDLTGRIIHKDLKVDDKIYNYQSDNLSNGAYIVQVSLANGSVVSKKIVI